MKNLLLSILFIISLIFILPINKVNATAVGDVRKQISDTNNQIEILNTQIKKYEDQIAQTSEQKNSLSKIIKNLNLTRDKLSSEKNIMEKKILIVNLSINNLNSGINNQRKSINNSKLLLSKMIYNLYINDHSSLIEKLLMNKKLSEISVNYNSIESINKEMGIHLKEIETKKKELLISVGNKKNEQNKLTSLHYNLNLKQKAVEITKKNKNKILIITKNKESNFKKLLKEQQIKRTLFLKDIAKYEAHLHFILNPEALPQKGSEVLSFPLNHILVTSPYGPRWGGFHRGIDLRASIGTYVKSMADGVVIGTGNTDISCKGASLGKWVFIKYNNGLSSTYGHLSSILIRKGQDVKTGDIVGLSGNTGYSMAPHLHVSVYASNGVKIETIPSKSCNGKTFTQPVSALTAYLNPAFYLPIITKNMIKK